MSQTYPDIIKSTDCKTMGHSHCKKILRSNGNHVKLISIVHYVYGTRRVENIRN